MFCGFCGAETHDGVGHYAWCETSAAYLERLKAQNDVDRARALRIARIRKDAESFDRCFAAKGRLDIQLLGLTKYAEFLQYGDARIAQGLKA